MAYFLNNRTQRAILNDQYSLWAKVEAGVSQGSVLGPLLFLIYINDLSENLASNPKLFADDISLFLVIKDNEASDFDLNNDLKKISEWVFQWKMNFNPAPAKQAQEMIFSRRVKIINYHPLFFNQNVVPQTSLQKHLEMLLNTKFNFSEQLKPFFRELTKT